MRRSLLAAAALVPALYGTPAHAQDALVLTCALEMPAFGSGEGTCNLTGVLDGDAYAIRHVDVDLYNVTGGLCMATGTASGALYGPSTIFFDLTWAGPVGVVTTSGATTGGGVAELVLVSGDPCFSPVMSYTVVMELAGL